MSSLTDALAGATAAITAAGALGTASFGLVDATKAFGGGVSNCGFGYVERALKPFAAALNHANADWRLTVRANWINGMAKDDQKAAAKSLIRLGLSSANAAALAVAGHVDEAALRAVLTAVETGGALTTQDAQLLGRFNAAIDAAMDAGFERGDQQYRNASRLTAGLISVGLALWAGYLLYVHGMPKDLTWSGFASSQLFGSSILAGIVAVPIAPMAKDLASSLQAAAAAVKAV
jgi:hypothetical protein